MVVTDKAIGQIRPTALDSGMRPVPLSRARAPSPTQRLHRTLPLNRHIIHQPLSKAFSSPVIFPGEEFLWLSSGELMSCNMHDKFGQIFFCLFSIFVPWRTVTCGNKKRKKKRKNRDRDYSLARGFVCQISFQNFFLRTTNRTDYHGVTKLPSHFAADGNVKSLSQCLVRHFQLRKIRSG